MKKCKGDERLKGKKILVVDDSPDMRDIVRAILNKCGDVVIIEAENGEHCIEIMKKDFPDLIFMDYYMSNMDGLNTAKTLADANGDFSTPIILMSGDHNVIADISMSSSPIKYFLPKPFTIKQLIEKSVEAIASSMDH